MTQEQPGAEKLVRDKIPQIIRETGAEPLVRVADDAEYHALLRHKLLEEVNEFLDSGATEELADIFEVILALASQLGVDAQALEAMRAAKAAERGGFAARVIWRGNQALDR